MAAGAIHLSAENVYQGHHRTYHNYNTYFFNSTGIFGAIYSRLQSSEKTSSGRKGINEAHF